MERLASQVRQLDRQEGRATMSFYVVLPSDASKNEFSNNASNSYKVRLPSPLGLQGSWEVGLASISLPDAVPTVRGLMDAQDDTVMMFAWGSYNTANSQIATRHQTYPFSAFDNSVPTTGKEMCEMLISTIFNAMVFGLVWDSSDYYADQQWRMPNGELLYPNLKMDGGDLVLDYSNVYKSTAAVSLYFYASFAENMRWIYYDSNGTPYLGPNIRYTATAKNGYGTEDLDSGLYKDVTEPSTGDGRYWIVQGGWLKLSFHASWRFLNIDAAFEKLTGHNAKYLYVYSSVGQSQTVGGQITDILREIPFNAKGAGRQYFEPTLVQYKPVRNNDIDIIEVQVAETNGKLTDFQPGVTSLTLHFKQRT